jgi:hypothetical protein
VEVILKFPEHQRLQLYLRLLFAVFLFVYGYLFLILGCYRVLAGLLTKPGLVDLTGASVGGDFIAFWTGSAMSRAGDPAGVYNYARLHAAEQAVLGMDLPYFLWNYPPTFSLLVLPLSLLPYLPSFFVWIIATLSGYLMVIRRIVPHHLAPWLGLAFPIVTVNLLYGQNGFLSAALLGAGLILLESRPLTGGFFLGLLSYKPQLAILIPVALLAGRRYRGLAALAVTAAGLALASLAVLGLETWMAFWNNLPKAAGLANRSEFWQQMPTVLVSARLLGADSLAAGLFQALSALAAIGAVIWAWAQKAPFPHKAAVLTTGIFLATPYALVYDLTILGLAFAWLGWEEYTEGSWPGEALLMICWVGLTSLETIRKMTGLQICPLILTLMLSLGLYRVARARRTIA